MKTTYTTYNRDRPTPGARAVRRHLYALWGGNAALMEQWDNAEMELFTVTDEIVELQERAENLRREIAGLGAEMIETIRTS